MPALSPKKSFSKTWELFIWNVHIEGDSIAFLSLCGSVGVDLQWVLCSLLYNYLPPVMKIGENLLFLWVKPISEQVTYDQPPMTASAIQHSSALCFKVISDSFPCTITLTSLLCLDSFFQCNFYFDNCLSSLNSSGEL